jgi:hypothetical protein
VAVVEDKRSRFQLFVKMTPDEEPRIHRHDVSPNPIGWARHRTLELLREKSKNGTVGSVSIFREQGSQAPIVAIGYENRRKIVGIVDKRRQLPDRPCRL